MALKTTEVRFKVVNVKGKNEDGKDRQELLRYFSEESEKNVLQFHRGEVLHDNHQLIEVMVNNEKVGELMDEDYVNYESTKSSVREGKLNIYSELLDDGTIEYTCEVVFVIPYVASPEERAKVFKRKRIVILIMAAFFLIYAIYSLIQKEWKEVIVAILGCALMLYWTFIRDPKKDDAVYQFIENGKRKKSI